MPGTVTSTSVPDGLQLFFLYFQSQAQGQVPMVCPAGVGESHATCHFPLIQTCPGAASIQSLNMKLPVANGQTES